MATPVPANEARFTLESVARLTGGTLHGPASDEVQGVVLDSRAVRDGNLFVAIEGQRHDAHRFVGDAKRAGARAVVVRRGADIPADLYAIEVDDTLYALGQLAAAHRKSWGKWLVAITGSAGKTSTKELAAAALQGQGARVARSAGNLNNLVGLPMTLFALGDEDAAVVELGTNRPGEIGRLAEIAQPQVGVVTLVAPAHTEGLGSVSRIAEEKSALWRALPASGTAIANGDDEMLRGWLRGSPARTQLTFGTSDDADVQLKAWSMDADFRTRCEYALRGRSAPIHMRMQRLGETAALNAAGALAIALAYGGDLDTAAAAIAEVPPTEGRMCPRTGRDGSLVIDDSYNANPRSVTMALDTAASLARARGSRLVAALGDMLELGDASRDAHCAVARHAVQAGVSVFVGVGGAMEHAVHTAAHEGGDAVQAMHAASVRDATAALQRILRRGDVVLVKGSRSVAMDELVRAMTRPHGAEKNDDPGADEETV